MDRLSLTVAGVVMMVSASAPAASLDQWRPQIAEAARRFDLPAGWIAAVIAAESDGDPHALSSKGAMGLMQLLPATWNDLRGLYHLGGDPFDPGDNILAGTAYLRAMWDRFGYPGLFAAYNAGPARYEAYLRGNEPLPEETRRYLSELTRIPQGPVSPRESALFFPLLTGGNTPASKSEVANPNGLFVPLGRPIQERR
ncbi:transglycosylase-like protein with SLT domain [Nitrospirillum amazonense]|uniref:Transglycosylase-like protein with SLT domain n=1 Tax=Nitrospirillum amazonense TaxID=28077 RepID=A0A560K1K4_9PROT|nr:lytic transglycosylase domain-containing protein [Nitrospirillum amazonense]TWB77192.1 transglycosylase-like protein with SLT domain [Nitrospirillum amazonense]